MLYLAELLNQDKTLCFGYTDDVCLYRASKSLDKNVKLLANDVKGILSWGAKHKVAFALEKIEIIHFSWKGGNHAPLCIVNNELTVQPITTALKAGEQPALRWLGVWFDRRLTFRRHVTKRAAKAQVVAYHIRGLAHTVYGPPASVLRKAVVTYVLSSILYGTEAWYTGRRKPSRAHISGSVSARIRWHVKQVNRTIA
jgi:hypothetical protein